MCTPDNKATSIDLDWVDTTSCTLPTAEQPIRVNEFDNLFATSVQAAQRVDATTLRLTLDAAAEDRARDLAARESSCCSFFGFDFTPADNGALAMQVTVRAAHIAALDGFAARAAAAAGLTAAAAS